PCSHRSVGTVPNRHHGYSYSGQLWHSLHWASIAQLPHPVWALVACSYSMEPAFQTRWSDMCSPAYGPLCDGSLSSDYGFAGEPYLLAVRPFSVALIPAFFETILLAISSDCFLCCANSAGSR